MPVNPESCSASVAKPSAKPHEPLGFPNNAASKSAPKQERTWFDFEVTCSFGGSEPFDCVGMFRRWGRCHLEEV